MDCSRAIELIQNELDCTLGAEDARELASHLEACPDCARVRSELLAIDDALSRVPLEVAPHRVTESILEEVSRRNAAHQLAEPLTIGAAVAAGAALTVFGALKATSAGSGGGLWSFVLRARGLVADRLGWFADRAPEMAGAGEGGGALDIAVWVVVAALLALVVIGGRRLSRELREDLS